MRSFQCIAFDVLHGVKRMSEDGCFHPDLNDGNILLKCDDNTKEVTEAVLCDYWGVGNRPGLEDECIDATLYLLCDLAKKSGAPNWPKQRSELPQNPDGMIAFAEAYFASLS